MNSNESNENEFIASISFLSNWCGMKLIDSIIIGLVRKTINKKVKKFFSQVELLKRFNLISFQSRGFGLLKQELNSLIRYCSIKLVM